MNRYLKVTVEAVVASVVFLLLIVVGDMFYHKIQYIFDIYTVVYIALVYILSELYFKAKQVLAFFIASILFTVVQLALIWDIELKWIIALSVMPFVYSVVVLGIIRIRDARNQ